MRLFNPKASNEEVQAVLGIRHGHDAAAAIVVDGKIVADVAEERFSRVKNDTSYPERAIGFCLEQAGIESTDLDAVAFSSDSVLPPPFLSFFDVPPEVQLPRQPEAPVLPVYIEKRALASTCRVVLVPHHLAHAEAAYRTSGLHNAKAQIVTMDGVGDGVATAVWSVDKNRIQPLRKWDGTGSIGWFYACSTEAMGWRHSSDEWKTMGLAAYGTPRPGALRGYYPEYADGELVKPHDYGLAHRWPDHGANHYHMQDSVALQSKVEQLGREDFAAEVQRVTEEQSIGLILYWLEHENVRNLCCAGGCFLNVKMNQRLWYTGKLDTHWVYPNPGDAGIAAGAALRVYYEANPDQPSEKLTHLYFGPSFSADEIKKILDRCRLKYEFHEDIHNVVARHLADNRIVGWFQGRMESGPRALGNRSILMSPLQAANKDIINASVKYREAFRPFCPSLLYEAKDDYLVNARDEPFMITSFDVRPDKRDVIPAVTHVDGTARPQLVRRATNSRYYDLIKAFGDLTGHPVLLNTSFNVKGEPIVCNPREAIKCFYDTGLEILVIDRFLVKKPTIR